MRENLLETSHRTVDRVGTRNRRNRHRGRDAGGEVVIFRRHAGRVHGGIHERRGARHQGGRGLARHGFVNNTAPDKPALALLRIHPGGAIRITGGGTMILFK